MKEKKLLPAGRLSRFIFALTLPLANMLYVLTNRVMAERGQALIWKATIDDYIPFIAAAIIPYIWWHLQILISLIWFISIRKKTDILYRYVTSIVLVTIISIFIFVAMPTRVIRPQVSGTDIFSQLTRFLYSIDEPYNC